MADAETIWILAVGGSGLVAFAAGSILSAAPPIDADLDHVVESLSRRRGAVLAGSVLSLTGAGLLLWPLAAVTTMGTGEAWPSLALFSVAIAVLGFAIMAAGLLLVAALAWRNPRELPAPVARLCLDASHLAIWSVSAPIAAVFVTATTAVGVQNELFGPLVVLAAVAKVFTVAVEVTGTGQRSGWNAGGWAAGTSGYATIAWFVLVFVSLA